MTEPTNEMTLEEARQYAAVRLHAWRHNDPARIPKELRCIRTLLRTADDVVGELREALEGICCETGRGDDGFIDWQRCVDRIQSNARSALSRTALAEQGQTNG